MIAMEQVEQIIYQDLAGMPYAPYLSHLYKANVSTIHDLVVAAQSPQKAGVSSGATSQDGRTLSWTELKAVVHGAIPESWADLPGLHGILYDRGISIRPGMLKDAVITLAEEGLVAMRPWTESLYQLPHPQYAILQPQNRVMYFVRRQGGTLP